MLTDRVAPPRPVNQQAATAASRGIIPLNQNNPIVGTFDSRGATSKIVTFASPYAAPPNIPVALSMVDITGRANPRIRAYPSHIQKNKFEIHTDCWLDTEVNAARCTWLEIAADDPDFQFGSYSTENILRGDQAVIRVQNPVSFPRSYTAPPIVVVWIAGFGLAKDKRWRLKAFATNITKSGFTIHLDAWGDSILYSGITSWVAYPATKPGVASGHIRACSTRPSEPAPGHNSGFEEFGPSTFNSQPRVMLALDSFDLCNKHPMRVAAEVSEVSQAGMRWSINTSLDSVLYSAGASYIALS